LIGCCVSELRWRSGALEVARLLRRTPLMVSQSSTLQGKLPFKEDRLTELSLVLVKPIFHRHLSLEVSFSLSRGWWRLCICKPRPLLLSRPRMATQERRISRDADPDRGYGATIMERFRRIGPPSFKGESNPDVAESWIRETEKIFRAIRCPEEDKVNLATFTLQDRADVWWTSALHTIFQNMVDIVL